MNIHRIAKHVLMPLRQVNRAFPNQTLMVIETAITASETAHLGEIRFVVESRLDGMPLMKGHSARERAIEVFSQLRMWDTELRSATPTGRHGHTRCNAWLRLQLWIEGRVRILASGQSVIETVTQKVIDTIKVGNGPLGIAFRSAPR